MTDVVIVGEAVAGEAEKTRKQVEKLVNTINSSNFDLAELLHKVKKNRFYTTVTFQEYLGGLGVKVRKAQYLVRMVEVMDLMQVPREAYEPIGVAKLREITSLNPGDTYENPVTHDKTPMSEFIKAFIADAANMTIDELQNNVRILKGEVGENDLTWLNIRLKRQTLDATVRPALERAKVNIGTVATDSDGIAKDASDGRALEVIAAEYLIDPETEPEVN